MPVDQEETTVRSDGAPLRGSRGPVVALKWVAAAAILLVALVAAGVIVLSALFASGELSDRITSVVNDAIGTDSTRFVVERVRGTLFRGAVLDRPRLLVRTQDGEATWASARRIRVNYDLLAFLFPSPRTLRLDVDSLNVRFVHDSHGAMVFPRFAVRPKPKTSGPETRIHLVTRHGSVSLDWEGIRFRELMGKALITTAPGRSTIMVERLSATADSSARAAGTIRAQGLLTFAHGIMRVDPLEIEHGDSRIQAHGDWSLSQARVQEGAVVLNPLRMEDVLRFAGMTSPPKGLLRGEITFAGVPTNGQADACLEGEISGEPVDTLLVGATFTSQTVDVTSFRLRVRDAEATGRGQIRTSGDLEGTVRFRGVNPAFLPWWKPPEGVPRGSLAGTARVTARRTRPRPTVHAEIALEPGKLGRFPILAGRLRARTAPDGAAALDSSWLDLPGGRLHARGTLRADGVLDATLAGFVQDLGRMDSILAPVVADAGSARLSAELSGPIGAPSFTARAEVWGARLANGAACDTLGVTARGRLGPDARAEADVTARGLSLKDRPLGNAEAALTIGDRIVVQRYEQALGDTTLQLRGSFAVSEQGTDGVVDSLRFSAGAIRFRNVEPIRMTIIDGHVRAAPMSLDLSPGRLDVDLDWDVKRNRIDSRGAFHGFDVTRLPGPLGQEEVVRGEARGQFLASGALSDPDVSVWLDVLQPAFGGVRGDTLSLELEYAPGVLSVGRVRWVAGPSHVDLRGTVRAPFTLEESLRRFAKKDRAWASRVTLALTGDVDSLDLGVLAAADTTFRTLDGTTTLDARITGTADAPVLAVSGNIPYVTYQGVEGQVHDLSLGYASERLAIQRFEFTQGKSNSTVEGEFPLDLSIFAKERILRDAPLRLAVRIPEADFKIATLVSPLIGASGGRLKITADITGTPRKSKITGSMELADGTLRVAGRDEVLEGISLVGTFNEEQLTITEVTARQGTRGRLTGSGTWRWSGLPPGTRVVSGPPGEYTFTIRATEFTTSDRESYLFRVTGTFLVQNGRSRLGEVMPRISGTAVLSKGDLTLKLTEPSEEPPEVPFLYDVTVDVPNGLFYRTVDSDVELTGKLRLMNDGDGDLALGVMSVKKGRYYFFTREIGNLTGDFTFNSVDKIDPEMAVDGETKLDQDHIINVSLTGRASQPVVNLWGGKGMEGIAQADLWKALTFGQFSSGGSEDRIAGGESKSGSGLNVPIRDYLFRNAERWLSSSGFIDTIDLRSGARSGSSEGAAGGPIDLGTVGVGKYVTSDLFLNYSRDFSGRAENQLSAEYRVTRRLLLKGQQIQRASGLERPEQEYNLDLKIRLEY